jgi:hypothetical protein
MKEELMSCFAHREDSDRPRVEREVGSVNREMNADKVVDESILDEIGLGNWKKVNSIFPSTLPPKRRNEEGGHQLDGWLVF